MAQEKKQEDDDPNARRNLKLAVALSAMIGVGGVLAYKTQKVPRNAGASARFNHNIEPSDEADLANALVNDPGFRQRWDQLRQKMDEIEAKARVIEPSTPAWNQRVRNRSLPRDRDGL